MLLGTGKAVTELQKKIARFKDMDFKVKLGSTLEKDIRDYYVEFEKAYKGTHYHDL